jgi:hypothetical protein
MPEEMVDPLEFVIVRVQVPVELVAEALTVPPVVEELVLVAVVLVDPFESRADTPERGA